MPAGRPTDYRDEYAEQARKLCELGATDTELADFFEVDVRTIYRWKLDHEEFCQSVKNGKAEADERVERSLYHRALGHSYTEQHAFKLKGGDGGEVIEIVDVERFAPADTTAAIFWMKNRRSLYWRDKQEVEHSAVGDLAALIAGRRARVNEMNNGDEA